MHNLDKQNLARYIVDRCNHSHYPFMADFTPDGDGVIIALTANRLRRAVTLRPQLIHKERTEILEIAVEADIPQIQSEEVAHFLNNLLEDDHVFEKGGALYSPERYNDLQRLKSILQRQTSQSENYPIIACEIVDKKVNHENLKKAMWDYMVRPILIVPFRI